MKKYIYTLVLFQLLSTHSFSQNIEMSGIIADSKTKSPIEFVNIGILNKNIGTISTQNGNFSLTISKKYQNDSLTISHISYYPIRIPVEKIKDQTIFLQPRINELPEIVISSKKKKEKKIGIKRHNPQLYVGAMSIDSDVIEYAQRINIQDKFVKVKYVNIYIKEASKSNNIFIRINFYKNVNNAPGERIVFENIIQEKKIKTGWLQFDLTKTHVNIDEDFFVSVEFIPYFKNPQSVTIGGIMGKKRGYSRENSHGKWDKMAFGAPSINVEIEY